MKAKYISLMFVAALFLSACSDSFLDRKPDGSSLVEGQYRQLDDVLEGTVRGLWSTFYAYGGKHDVFGVRSIDMYTDLLSGDMAMSKSNMGWFEVDERGLSRQYRSSYIWSFYYDIIRLCNKGINAVELEDDLDLDNLTEMNAQVAYYYAELLAVRGWCYANLIKYFSQTTDLIDPENKLSLPIYDESYTRTDELLGAPRATVSAVYERVSEDLITAIKFLDADTVQKYCDRESKLEIDADVARLIIAYAYINWGGTDNYDLAFDYAKEVIDNKNYNILPHSQLFSTGFADLSNTNWMWGEPVTTDNSTALASFFGQVDIHTYSYAWAGDAKSIDESLYNTIVAKGWDDRANWFRSVKSYKLVPDRKFYSPNYKDALTASQIDRDWLCDQVWMRFETAYLIAAEAALYKTTPSLDTAALYLDAIMSERIIEGKETEYATYKATLTSSSALKDALIYNWRVELWGEGYSLQTFRRLEHSRTLGKNHLSRSSSTLTYSDGRYEFAIPTSETRYNPFISDTEELVENND